VSRLFEWHERGRGLEVHAEPGLVRVEVHDDRGRRPVELSPAVIDALVDGLEGHDWCVPAEEYHDKLSALNDAERDRDTERDRANTLEGDLRHALAELETLKSALDLADQRARAAEADLDELRLEHRELASAALRTGKR